MKYEQLICKKRGPNGEALWVTLNNQEAMNAMSDTMQKELFYLFKEIAFDNSIRCVVLTGAGEKSIFKRGRYRTLPEFRSCQWIRFRLRQGKFDSAFDELYGKTYHRRGQRLLFCRGHGNWPFAAILFMPAKMPSSVCLEINLGLLPGWGGTVRLPRKIPVNKAKEMIYRGEMITADQAYHWGLVNHVLPSIHDLYETVEKIVDEMISKAPLALRAAKKHYQQLHYLRQHRSSPGH